MADDPGDKGGTPPGSDIPEPTGDGGVAERLRQSEAQNGAYRRRVRELETQLAEERNGRALAIDNARTETRSETLKTANRRILQAEVRSLAAGRFNDPADALLHLPLDTFTVADDGTFDAAPVTAALDKLLTEKPYLARTAQQSGQNGNGAGSADQGARGGQPLDHNAALRQMFRDQTGQR
jgi:hypothetical protein